jgi:hypothetical protein
MPAQTQYEANDICVLRISGILKRSEFRTEQSVIVRQIDSGLKPRLLVILEKFEGWERGADWGNDLEFLFSHSVKIAKNSHRRRATLGDAGACFCWSRSTPRASEVLSR